MNTILESYEINRHTLALFPARHIDYETIVLQDHYEWYVRQTPLEIIQRACLEGGSSYDGRRKAVIHFTGAKKKVPGTEGQVPRPRVPGEYYQLRSSPSRH